MSASLLAPAPGAVIGLALGALGGGGSILAVPALIYLLGLAPAAAATASLAIVAATALTALVAHMRDGNVRWRTGALLAAAGLPPAMLGGALAGHLPPRVLTGAFAAVAATAALRMFWSAPERAAGADGPTAGPGRVLGAGAGLGAVTGVLGVGGGFLAVPALVSVVGLRMRAAVGTSLLVISVNALAALAVRTQTIGTVDWTVVAPFAAAALLGAWSGKRLATRVSATVLKRAFASALLVVAAAMLTDALT